MSNWQINQCSQAEVWFCSQVEISWLTVQGHFRACWTGPYSTVLVQYTFPIMTILFDFRIQPIYQGIAVMVEIHPLLSSLHPWVSPGSKALVLFKAPGQHLVQLKFQLTSIITPSVFPSQTRLTWLSGLIIQYQTSLWDHVHHFQQDKMVMHIL